MRTIDADAFKVGLKLDLEKALSHENSPKFRIALRNVAIALNKAIDKQPTVKCEPSTAEWLNTVLLFSGKCCECSKCGAIYRLQYLEKKSRYCPNCGRKMWNGGQL